MGLPLLSQAEKVGFYNQAYISTSKPTSLPMQAQTRFRTPQIAVVALTVVTA